MNAQGIRGVYTEVGLYGLLGDLRGLDRSFHRCGAGYRRSISGSNPNTTAVAALSSSRSISSSPNARVRHNPYDPATMRHLGQCEFKDTTDRDITKLMLKVKPGLGPAPAAPAGWWRTLARRIG